MVLLHKDKNINWAISDFVDLEYFFVHDRNAEENLLSERDRDFYLSEVKDHVQERSSLFRQWLNFRRKNHRVEQKWPLPGEKIDLIVRSLPYVLFVLGILAGVSLAKIVMYRGDFTNVFFAFLALVFLPSLVTLVLGVFFPVFRFVSRRRPVGKGGEWVIGKLLPRLSRLFQKKVKGENRVIFDQVWGNLKARRSLYSGVMNWFTYRSFQSFGLGFSSGVMATLILLGLFTNMSFGWGTTFGLNENFVYKVVDKAAIPWSFLGFDHQPSLDQVRQSMIQSHGITQDDLIRNVWAKFFLWAIVIYTVLPRLALLGIANIGLDRAYRNLSFNDAQCEGLLRRMKHPRVKTGGGAGSGKNGGEGPILPAEESLTLRRFRVLLPTELLKRPMAGLLQNEIQEEFNVIPVAIDQITLDETADAKFFTSLNKEIEDSSVMIIFESWQPCINSTLSYLRSLRKILGDSTQIIVCLIGREVHDRWATPNNDQDLKSWRSRLAALGDPCLLVHRWGEN
jgi:hypothetical protein